jgi:tRNA(Ile)-lysidine synthase
VRGLEDARRVLDARLSSASRAPLAVALSGGGDSTALLLLAAEWAAAAGRPLLALTVDHGLNPASAAWTEHCARLAERAGAGFSPLSWIGRKPASGLPAAARIARHRLLADAARQAGARVILMGHTADDLAEAAAMRAEGGSTPSPEAWRPSPAWPEGRGLFLLRPLLGTRRADLRDGLVHRGEGWIEDPANDDLRFARARARAALQGAAPPPAVARVSTQPLAQAATVTAAGEIRVARPALRQASAEACSAFVAAAALCASGGASPPKPQRVARLAETLAGDASGVHTLAGARILADPDEVVFARNPARPPAAGSRLCRFRSAKPACGTGVSKPSRPVRG